MTVGRIPSVEGGIQPTIFDAKGDVLTATANDTPARLAVGTNDTILMAASGESTGLKWGGAWSAYTSTTSGLTLGNGTLQARYVVIGKTVNLEILFTLGSTSAVTGTPTFSLPSGLNSKIGGYSLLTSIVALGDYGVGIYPGLAVTPTGSGIYVGMINTAGTYAVENANISATVPFTWTTNDYISIRATYEAA